MTPATHHSTLDLGRIGELLARFDAEAEHTCVVAECIHHDHPTLLASPAPVGARVV